jgi:hypothetical protein
MDELTREEEGVLRALDGLGRAGIPQVAASEHMAPGLGTVGVGKVIERLIERGLVESTNAGFAGELEPVSYRLTETGVAATGKLEESP